MQSKFDFISILEKKVRREVTVEEIEQLKSGCHIAYGKVYLQWRKPIYNFLYTLIGNASDAEDITQETFTALWVNREKLIPEKGVRAILYAIARNSAMQLFRDRRVRQNYMDSSSVSDIDLNTSYDILVRKETELLIEVLLSRMPPQQQEIFKMSSREGMSAEDISQKLGIKRETVYQQLSRAKGQITKLLGLLSIFISV